MEMLSWETGTIDCGATTYWYGLPGTTDNGIIDEERAAGLLKGKYKRF